VSLLPSGQVSQRLIARNLHRSVSALQKQLKAEGVSFREILDETRAELAQRLVREQDYTLAEITYLLGFADQANFSRAFKRWFGDTPSVYRMRARPRRQESSNLSV
jgi:AraC-like DNA-binding protein